MMINKDAMKIRTAFSLIELLVVVTIITLLCALLLTTLQAAQRTANDILCQSNLCQAAKAWMVYLNDNNGFFYQAINANIKYGGWTGDREIKTGQYFCRPLNPYLGLPTTVTNPESSIIFQCPRDNGGVPYTNLPAFSDFGTSYQMNILLADQTQINVLNGNQKSLYIAINKLLPNMNISRAAEPSRLLLMGDYGWINRWMPGIYLVTEWHNFSHYYNLAFVDGHVDFIEIQKGLFISSTYRVQPFEELDNLALSVQQEKP